MQRILKTEGGGRQFTFDPSFFINMAEGSQHRSIFMNSTLKISRKKGEGQM